MDPVSAAGSGADILSLTMLRKAMDMAQAQNAALLETLPPPPAAPAPSGRVDVRA